MLVLVHRSRPATIAPLIIGVALTACSGGGGPTAARGESRTPPFELAADTTPPVLQSLGVRFAPYDAGTGRAGDFIFDPGLRSGVETFGDLDISPSGATKLRATLNFRTAAGVAVIAVADGVIMGVDGQPTSETPDYEILQAPSARSTWRVTYDHVVQPRVRVGDGVRAGDTLALAVARGAGRGFWELMVVDYRDGWSHCPVRFLASGARAPVETALRRHMADWETFKRDTTIFDEARMPVPGCYLERARSE